MALDHGVNVIDTANIYGQGDSERIIGQAVKGRRDEAFIITKIGYNFSGGSRLFSGLKPVLRLAASCSSIVDSRLGRARDEMISQDFSPESLARDLEGSLRRLNVEVVDGILLHDPDTRALQDEATAGFLRDAKRQGRVRHFGVSVGNVEAAVKALEIADLELLQVDIETARGLAAHPAASVIRERGVALFVRQLLRPPSLGPDEESLRIQNALPGALSVSNVTSAIVGLSTREHLQQAIDAVS